MKHPIFSQNEFHSIEKPMHEFMDLNIKTFQSLLHFTPKELFSMNKPEELLKKNMDLFILNSHKGLEYLEQMFYFVEKNMMATADLVEKNTKKALSQAQMTALSKMKQAVDVEKQAVKRSASSSLKKTIKPNLKQAQKSIQKSMKDSPKPIKKNAKSVASTPKKNPSKSATRTSTSGYNSLKNAVDRPSANKSKPALINKNAKNMNEKMSADQSVKQVSATSIKPSSARQNMDLFKK